MNSSQLDAASVVLLEREPTLVLFYLLIGKVGGVREQSHSHETVGAVWPAEHIAGKRNI